MSERRAGLRLVIRTPGGVVVDTRVDAVTAEDITGRFGLRPGVEPLIAALVPAMITYRDEAGEHFVAAGRGFLYAERQQVRVAVRTAVLCTSLEHVREELLQAQRREVHEELSVHRAFRSLEQMLRASLIDEERAR